VEQITGRGASLLPLVTGRQGVADIEATLRATMAEHGVSVVFTDLQAGSCSMAARRALRELPGAMLIAGVNLPMLLDFVLADNVPPEEAARHAVERGRAAITIHEPRP
jgi:PTS system N-acetylgalactosamine-specific IIA component